MTGRVKLIFTASILLNIGLVCAGAGLAYKMCWGDRFGLPDNVSAESRAAMEDAFKEGRTRIRPLIDTAKERRKAVEAVITADAFDREAYDEAVTPLLTTRQEIARAKADVMGGALARLPAEDRRAIAGRLLDRLEGRRPHRPGADQPRKAPDQDAPATP